MFILFASVIFTFFQLAHSWNNHIFVNKENGVDNTSCLQGRIPCATFNMALKGLIHDSTVISIAPGTYTLEQGNETSIGSRLEHIAIIGSNDTIIMCASLAGLEVLSSYDILFKSIVFNGCGQYYIWNTYYFFYAALYINECQNVTLLNVSILYSNGTGLFFDEPYGDLHVENSSIIGGTTEQLHSTVSPGLTMIVGGGIVLVAGAYDSEVTLVINKSRIIDNDYEDNTNYYCQVVSGGAIVLHHAANYKVIVDSCTIVNNSRGFVVNSDLVAFEIFNTKIFNRNNSKIIPSTSNSFLLSMLNARMTDTLSIFVPNTATMNTKNISDGYLTWCDNIAITAHFTTIEQYNYSLKLEEWYAEQCSEFYTVSTGKCYSTDRSYTGHCPFSYSNCKHDKQICSCEYGRHGPLCGQCIEGQSVAINSLDLTCVVDCYSNIKGWGLLIALEFIPLTVMIAIIAILNVNLNQGSLNAYVLFCQLITINFPSVGYPAWFVTLQGDSNVIFDYTLLPFRIFNLGFILNLDGYMHNDYNTKLFICLSKSSTALTAISFWYVIAAYPLLLLALLYSCVIMYDKGWRCVVCIVRPVHRLLARFWRSVNIQPSLTHTIASVYTLCFTQLAATSLKILHPTQYHDEQGNNHTRFFYDGSQSYFRGWHGFAGSVAILVLLGLIVTTLYLLVYPFKLFQRLFDKLTLKKDLLLSVTDVFTGPYKDGTNGSWDYRYFAGTHFALQLVIMTFYYIPLENNIPLAIGILEVIVCTLCVCVLVIFRPYKRNIHNFSETLLFLILIVFACYQFFSGIHDIMPSATISSVLCIPMSIALPYSIVWIVKKFYCFCRYRKAYIRPLHVQQQCINSTDEQNQYNDEDDILADRLLHPEDYNEHRVNQCNEGNNSYGTFRRYNNLLSL